MMLYQLWRKRILSSVLMMNIGIIFEHFKGSEASDCKIATEGQQYNLTIPMDLDLLGNTGLTSLIIQNTNDVVAVCVLKDNKNCALFFNLYTAMDISENSFFRRLTFILSINKISRDVPLIAEGKWTARLNDKIVFSCFVHVISRTPRVTCNSKTCNDDVNLACWTTKVYPKTACEFHSKNKQIDPIISDLDISYHHLKLDERIAYYQCNCSLKIPMDQKMQNKVYFVDVSIYPKIKGHNKELTFPFKVETTIFIDTGARLQDCSEARRGTSYQLKFECTLPISSNPSKLFVEKDDSPIVVWDLPSNNCDLLFDQLVSIENNTIDIVSGLIYIVLNIYDVTSDHLNAIGNWTVKYNARVICSQYVPSKEDGMVTQESPIQNVNRNVPPTSEGLCENCFYLYGFLKKIIILFFLIANTLP